MTKIDATSTNSCNKKTFEILVSTRCFLDDYGFVSEKATHTIVNIQREMSQSITDKTGGSSGVLQE